ncbi:MAG TPA: hypothetical protein VFP32_03925 [Candidatus Saccharimonadales bacterium]|nr:hypothetical protein [Candidatus Saccharimonadales bacterium]
MISPNRKQLKSLATRHRTPLYIYSRQYLEQGAEELLNLCRPHGITARYAVKANPHHDIIKLFLDKGLQFDASSEYEVENLINNGVPASVISLSSQQPPRGLAMMLESDVRFVATSLHQLDLVSESGWQGNLAVRINPGVGTGHNKRTTTAGRTASFGIWHEYLPQILDWQHKSGCVIDRLHIHAGSGGDPAVWESLIDAGLTLVGKMPSVTKFDIGGGFKVARLPNEQAADMPRIMELFAQKMADFKDNTGRTIKLEIEPGSWLVANAGVLLAEVIDIVNTGPGGYEFLKLNTGMNDILRPAMYGAQHPIEVINDSKNQRQYVVVGHNCESGDLLTPAAGDPETLGPRLLNEARIGDLVSIGAAGAYCASMRAAGYNSFPAAAEIVV